MPCRARSSWRAALASSSRRSADGCLSCRNRLFLPLWGARNVQFWTVSIEIGPGIVTEQALVSELERLVSEARNPHTMQIDLLPTAAILRAMNEEDKRVPLAVEAVIPSIAAAVERVVHAFRHGGRLI